MTEITESEILAEIKRLTTLDAARRTEMATMKELIGLTGLSDTALRRALFPAVKEGRLKSVLSKENGHWTWLFERKPALRMVLERVKGVTQ